MKFCPFRMEVVETRLLCALRVESEKVEAMSMEWSFEDSYQGVKQSFIMWYSILAGRFQH